MSLVTAFLIGLLSLLHCFGMCGGIIGALSMSLQADIRENRWRLALYSLLYSVGRLASYVLGGLAGGLAGRLLVDVLEPSLIAMALRVVAGVLVILIGLYVAGWLPGLGRLERLGEPLWERLRPLGQRLLPVHTPVQALAFGLVWGWLPCGLVYSVLVLAALSGSAAEGGLIMLAFGLGTLPAVVLGGILSGRLIRLRRTPYLRPAAGILLVISGIFTLWINVSPELEDILQPQGTRPAADRPLPVPDGGPAGR